MVKLIIENYTGGQNYTHVREFSNSEAAFRFADRFRRIFLSHCRMTSFGGHRIGGKTTSILTVENAQNPSFEAYSFIVTEKCA